MMDDSAKWAMVPVEPTGGQLQAGLTSLSDSGVDDARVGDARRCYAAMLAAAPPPPAGSDGWLPIAEGGDIDEEVVIGFFRLDGTEYGRKRIARLRETDWPVRVMAWDQQQKVYPTHFQRIRSTPPVAPRG